MKGCRRVLKWIAYGIGGLFVLSALLVALVSPETEAENSPSSVNDVSQLANEFTNQTDAISNLAASEEAAEELAPTPGDPIEEEPTEPIVLANDLEQKTPTQVPPTPVPTITPVPTQVPPTPVPTITPVPTQVPPTPVPTITPVPQGPTASGGANLRSGPGLEFDVIGNVVQGQQLQTVYQSPAGDWYQLDNGGWIFAALVENGRPDLPVAPNIPSPPVVTEPVVPTSAPVVQPQQPVQGSCDCNSGDTLNCKDFDSHNTAMACFQYCLSTTGQDIHDLDRDGDGLVCESRG